MVRNFITTAGVLAALASPLAMVPGQATASVVLCVVTSSGCGTLAEPFIGTTNSDGSFSFTNRGNGWYDPPFVSGFTYAVVGTTFASVALPPVSGAAVYVGGSLLATLAASGSFTFGSGVSSFELRGIAPPLDEASAGFPTAYPVNLSFNGSFSSLTITPERIAVPEPATLALLGAGLLGLGAIRRRKAE